MGAAAARVGEAQVLEVPERLERARARAARLEETERPVRVWEATAVLPEVMGALSVALSEPTAATAFSEPMAGPPLR